VFVILAALVSTVSRALTSQLESTVRCAGNVELWLGQLLLSQMTSMHGLIRMCATFINEQEFNLLQFIEESIAQVNTSCGAFSAMNVAVGGLSGFAQIQVLNETCCLRLTLR
jgi:hypothetical protein